MSATATTPTTAGRTATEAVAARMRAFYDAWTARDVAAHFPLVAQRPDLLAWGSDTWESITGSDEFLREFHRWVASCPPWTRMEPRSRLIWDYGKAVVVADDMLADYTRDGEDGQVNFRVTMVWEQVDGAWLIIHGHISIPD